ncbi:MAG: TonB-dependent receptor plug domain-containing protein [Sediminicola sp.]
MNKKIYVPCAAFLVCTGVAVRAQQVDTARIQNLDEVVVSDSRFELKRENSGKTVIKITAEELERSQGRTIPEIINTKSGIEISGSRGRDGAILGVYARGGRGRQVLVVIDGVRVADPSSSSSEYDLRSLSAANVESIEIIKGAASTLYGTNAASAVILITTKKASGKKIAANVRSTVGTNQSAEDQHYNVSEFNNSVQVTGTLDRFTYAAGFSQRYSDGLSALVTPTNEKDDFSNISTDLRLGYGISDNFKVVLYGNQTKVRTDFDESFGYFDAPYQFSSKQERVGMSADLGYGKGSLNLNAALSDYSSENIGAFTNQYVAKNYVVDVYNKYVFNDRTHTILGLNYVDDRADFLDSKKLTITDPYLNVVYVSPFGANLNTGARLNNNSEYGSHFVYNINPSYSLTTPNGYVKVMGSYATSYITPSLTQLFGFYGANADLEPEEDRTLEAGAEWSVTDQIRISALYFDRKEENLILYGATGYINAESTIDASGVEVELDWRPVDAVRLDANYTFTERKGDNAIRIPKHKVNASLSYDLSSSSFASINYSLTGERLDTDFFNGNDVSLSSFSLVDLYVGHEVVPGKLKVFLNASNIFNEAYTEVFGFTTKGRNFRVGMNLEL